MLFFFDLTLHWSFIENGRLIARLFGGTTKSPHTTAINKSSSNTLHNNRSEKTIATVNVVLLMSLILRCHTTSGVGGRRFKLSEHEVNVSELPVCL
jgi:hypothetical protein